MLPVVAPPRRVAIEIVVYSWLTVAASLALWPLATGWVYGVLAAAAGAVLIGGAHRLLQPDPAAARSPSRCSSSTCPTAIWPSCSSRSRSTPSCADRAVRADPTRPARDLSGLPGRGRGRGRRCSTALAAAASTPASRSGTTRRRLDRHGPVVLRSTWDYTLRRDAVPRLDAHACRAAQPAPTSSSGTPTRSTCSELADAGVPITPTTAFRARSAARSCPTTSSSS